MPAERFCKPATDAMPTTDREDGLAQTVVRETRDQRAILRERAVQVEPGCHPAGPGVMAGGPDPATT